MKAHTTVGTRIFDPVKLDSMTEPLFVRVEKKKGNVRTPIPLPAGDDGVPQGVNWSKEDVRGIEQWLVNEWAGGGYYVITVSDSTTPTPQKMDWEIYYHPNEYPEKTPPTLAAAVSDRPIPPTQVQVRPMSTYPSVFPNGFPAGLHTPGYTGGGAVGVQPQVQDFQPSRGTLIASQLASAQADLDRRRYEDQIREMQAALAKAREDQLAAQHRQEIERLRGEQQERMRAEQSAQNERFSKLEQMIATLATTKPAIDPAIEQLKEQNRIMQAERDAERREREAERREREMRDLIQRQQDDTRRALEAMQAQFLATQQNKGPDPIIMMLQENARQQAEAIREQARQGAAQMAQLSSFMMNPRDIMAMAKESSNGLDQVTRSITNTYQDILQMQRAAVDQILQLSNTGGSETIALVKEGLERASSFAERFISGKTKEATVAQQSQAQMAQAQAAAMQAQAQALATQAAMQAQARVQSAAQPGAGVNGSGPGPGTNGTATKQPVASVRPTVPVSTDINKPPMDGWSTGPVPPPVPEVKVRRHLGRTDEEWFGPILPQVKELRIGVARFFESIAQVPPRLLKDNHVDGIEPEQAAEAILQAAAYVMQNQIPISAMIDLLGQGRIADFMDLLLPDISQQYRDEVAQMVMDVLQGKTDDDEEEDDDDEEDEDANETADAPPVTLVRPPRVQATS